MLLTSKGDTASWSCRSCRGCQRCVGVVGDGGSRKQMCKEVLYSFQGFLSITLVAWGKAHVMLMFVTARLYVRKRG